MGAPASILGRMLRRRRRCCFFLSLSAREARTRLPRGRARCIAARRQAEAAGVRVVALSNASYSVVHARVGGNRERGDRAQTQNGERTMI